MAVLAEVVRLGSLRMSIYAAPAYLARHGVPSAPHELTDTHWLALQDGTNRPRRLTLGGQEIAFLPRCCSNNQLSLQQLCEVGPGLALLGDDDAGDSVAAGRLLRLSAPGAVTELPVWALTP